MEDWTQAKPIYMVVCEVQPGVLADGIEDFEYAKKVAHAKAEEVWEERGVSLYCVVKDATGYGYFAVRYTPKEGGTFHVPVEYYGSVGA
jgi:hypothetical protein